MIPLRSWCSLLLLLFSGLLGGCTSLVTTTLINPNIDGMQRQTDLELVCEGAPAYLLMIDSMLARNPENSSLLQIAAQTYTAYGTTLQECGSSPARLLAISEKARLYGQALVGQYLPLGLQVGEEEFARSLAQCTKGDVPALYWGSLAWLTWILRQEGSAAAMADLVTIEKTMNRVLQLDGRYQNSGPRLFLGAYLATKPAMLGGNPQKSREQFEQALAETDRRFLLIQTTYAEKYARQTLDKGLHDTLLAEVLSFDLTKAPEFALSNQIAKRKAQRLLAEDFFAE